MGDNIRKSKVEETQHAQRLPVQSLVGASSSVHHDGHIAAATQQLEKLQVQGIPIDTYRQRLEGRRVYQHPQEMANQGPPMPYVNKYVNFQPQMPHQQQTHYNGVNYAPRVYPEMRNVNVPSLTMMYCSVPNTQINDMRYQAPWNMQKFETNVQPRNPDEWSVRSDFPKPSHANTHGTEQVPRQSRKPKQESSLYNKKGTKNGNGKSATDGMTLLPIVDSLNDSGNRAIFEEAMKETLLMEANDGLHKLKVTQESLGSMGDVKELSGSDESGVALYEKFKSLSEESVVYLSREFSGSKIIQQCLDTYDESFSEMLYGKLRKHQKLLSIDTYGNYVVQHLLQSKSKEIQNELSLMLEENLLQLSLNFYGCRVIQKAIKHLPAEFSDRCCTKLAPVALYCLQSQHANHVIKAFFSLQGDRVPKEMEKIHETICKNGEHVSTHVYGFKVLQAALGSGLSPELSRATVLSMEKNLITLSCSEYGNYLVQYFIESDIYNSRDLAISCIINAPVLLMTCHKFGSNVIEKAVVHGSHEQKSLIIQRMVQECTLSGSTETALMHIASNRFGNYVLQRIFEVSSLQDRELLASHLRAHARALGSSAYGKHLIKYL